MATERLLDFPVKATPVLLDIIYTGDSADADDEVQITIQSLINVYPTLTALGTAALVANTYFYLDSAAAGAVGTITPLAVTLLADATASDMLTTITALGLAGGTMTGAINMGAHQINALADPALAQDAATKNYVDTSISGVIPAGAINDLLYYATAGSTLSLIAAANNSILATSNTGVPSLTQTLPAAVQANITALGTIITGVWNGTLIGATFGGTGVNNGSNTLTMAGSVTFAGAFGVTITSTATTNATLPAGTTTLVPTTGTGATGTWNINISGNAATATSATTAANLTGLTALSLYGNPTGSTATGQAVTLGSGLSFSGTTLVATGLSPTLASSNILVGNASNVATAVALSGDGTLTNAGVLTIGSIGGKAVSLGGDLTLSGAFATTLTVTAATSLTLPTTGTLATTSQIPTLPLSLANGGTNANLTANVGGIFYSTASAGAILSGIATSNRPLLSTASGAPVWASVSYPTSLLANNLLYGASSNVIGQLLAGNSCVLTTNNTGQPGWVGLGAGFFIIGVSAAAPASSSYTLPTGTLTANQLLYASSTTAVSQLTTANNAVLATNGSGAPAFQALLPTINLPHGTAFNTQFGSLTVPASTTSTIFVNTGLAAPITPTSASNKVLVRCVLQVDCAATNNGYFQLANGSTPIGIGTSVGSRDAVGAGVPGGLTLNSMITIVMEWLDTPATTSAVTYNVMFKCVGAGSLVINSSITDTNSAGFPRGVSTITVQEIQA